MNDWDKLVAKTSNAFCVETVTTTTTYYNQLGENINKETKTESIIYVFDENRGKWVKGLKGEEE